MPPVWPEPTTCRSARWCFLPEGTELARAANARETLGDPTAHAEILAMRAAAAVLGDGWRLEGATLAVTVEPCTMCAGALVMARVARLVFGAWEPKTGAVGSLWDVVRDRRLDHRPEVRGGVLAAGVRGAAGGVLRPAAVSCVVTCLVRTRLGPGGSWPVSCPAVACPSGLRSTPRKRVTGNPRPRVQIPPPPPSRPPVAQVRAVFAFAGRCPTALALNTISSYFAPE